jgi:pseudouridine-5'-phosphate glycosidase
LTPLLVVSPVVRDALARKKPVVALETTVVTHGLPEGQGVRTALELESLVRERGAVPASVAVLGGRLRVGLSADDLGDLTAMNRAVKVNLSNLGAVVASGRPGSATVAVSVFAAARAGIQVMATGGLGGVHRGVEATGDVSSDLTALARHPVVVVCAGAKAVLDLPRTGEMLETLGVPVYGFRTAELPAFYRRASGVRVDHRFEGMEELARAVRAHWTLGSQTGVVVGNPIASEHEMPKELYEGALQRALAEAVAGEVRGRELTPFLLERMRQFTEGRSVFSNLALLESNVQVAAHLATELGALARDGGEDRPQ